MATRDERIIKAFGRAVRDLRTSHGITQEELAHACGVDRTYISLIERAKRQPSLTTIFALAQQLDVEPEEMLRRTKVQSVRRK